MNYQYQKSPSGPLRAGPGSPTIACSALAFHMHALPPPTRLSDCCKRRHLTLDAQGVDAPEEAWGGWGKPFTLRSFPHRSHYHMVQTSPIESIMHGHHKSGVHAHSPITSDSGSREGWRTTTCAAAQAASRPGMPLALSRPCLPLAPKYNHRTFAAWSLLNEQPLSRNLCVSVLKCFQEDHAPTGCATRSPYFRRTERRMKEKGERT